MQEEQSITNGTPKRESSGRLPAVRTKIVRGLVENYGVGVAEVARQVGISTSGVSKILTRTLFTLVNSVPSCTFRAEAAYLGREVGSIGKTEAAKYMGRDRSTMSLAVKRLEEGLERDPKRRKQLEDFCARLRRGRKRIYHASQRGLVSKGCAVTIVTLYYDLENLYGQIVYFYEVRFRGNKIHLTVGDKFGMVAQRSINVV